MDYKAYSLRNLSEIPQYSRLSKEQLFSIEVVSKILPFKSNNYVVNELIDWDNTKNDPLFILTFPQKEMLKDDHFQLMADLIKKGAGKPQTEKLANTIREKLNPHPAGQVEHNIPDYKGKKLTGIQHKYKETMLFFPSQGQTCHAYCTFCFRWPQFTGMENLKFAMKQSDLILGYLHNHPSITDLLITGGDPMVMNYNNLSAYLDTIITSKKHHLKNIRIGTKSLAFWPYRFISDKDSDDILRLFERIVNGGYHLSIMAHFSHPRELSTEVVKTAIKRIRATGAQIRTQSPVLRHINAKPELWAGMWKTQVQMGMVPYYMFIARDTGAQQYFGIPLVEAWKIFRKAYSQVSGLCRTVRGPSMSTDPGKIQILGVTKIKEKKLITLRFLQGRNPEWVARPFFAEYDENANWLDELKPAFGQDEFFFEEEFRNIVTGDSEYEINRDKYFKYSSHD